LHYEILQNRTDLVEDFRRSSSLTRPGDLGDDADAECLGVADDPTATHTTILDARSSAGVERRRRRQRQREGRAIIEERKERGAERYFRE
jgi:hypothetical protein